jgi:hypothetical protein
LRIRHPEPNGSRWATPPSLIQQWPGQSPGEYQDTFDLDDQGKGSSQALINDPLESGQSAARSLTFNLPAGNYVMTLVINAGVPLTLGNVIIDECE